MDRSGEGFLVLVFREDTLILIAFLTLGSDLPEREVPGRAGGASGEAVEGATGLLPPTPTCPTVRKISSYQRFPRQGTALGASMSDSANLPVAGGALALLPVLQGRKESQREGPGTLTCFL